MALLSLRKEDPIDKSNNIITLTNRSEFYIIKNFLTIFSQLNFRRMLTVVNLCLILQVKLKCRYTENEADLGLLQVVLTKTLYRQLLSYIGF